MWLLDLGLNETSCWFINNSWFKKLNSSFSPASNIQTTRFKAKP